jgi:hypothetical protein
MRCLNAVQKHQNLLERYLSAIQEYRDLFERYSKYRNLLERCLNVNIEICSNAIQNIEIYSNAA